MINPVPGCFKIPHIDEGHIGFCALLVAACTQEDKNDTKNIYELFYHYRMCPYLMRIVILFQWKSNPGHDLESSVFKFVIGADLVAPNDRTLIFKLNCSALINIV